ncbi:MAG: PAS domain S-box protein [Verrucomicrobia bacterium]|nr:PAS domain S-box protein [Verrucomicrobiota bacterium]
MFSAQANSFPRWLALAFGLALAVVLGGGIGFYRTQQRQARQSVEAQLKSIAQSKVNQIANWRTERLADATTVVEDPFCSAAATRWLAAPGKEDAEKLIARFRSIQTHWHFCDVRLVDATGQLRLSVNGPLRPFGMEDTRALAAALHKRRPVMTDLHISPNDLSIHLEVIAPLFAKDGEAAKPVGAVLLKSDAQQFLYPQIQSWPTPTRTAETLLVRRDGGDALCLNELRHQKDSALKLRIPLSRVETPAVMAVLGKEGVVEGADYRGVQVLAVLNAVPDSPWFLVTKMDAEEAFAGWRVQAGFIVALMLVLVAMLLAATGAVWQANGRERVQMQAAEALRESEGRFRGLFQSVPSVAVQSYKPDGTTQYWNEASERLYGYTAAEAIGRSLPDLIFPPEMREGMKEASRQMAQTGQPIPPSELSLMRKDGSRVTVFASHVIVRTPGREPELFCVDIDLTERKQAEERLAHLSRQHELVLRSAAEGILGLDLQGNHTFVNPAAAKMLGYEAGELLGLPSHSIWHHTKADGSSYPKEECQIHAVYRDGTVHRASSEVFWRKDGTSFPVEYASTPVYEQSRLIGAVVTFSDITVRKRAENEVRKLNAHLEQRVQERTAALAAEIAERKQVEESLKLFRTLVDRSNDAIEVLDPETGRFLDVNETGCRDLGYSREEFLALSVFDIDLLVNPSTFQSNMEVAGKSGGMTWVGVHRRKDGSTFPVEVHIKRVQLDRDYLVASVRDTTERKEAEEKLRSSQEALRALAARLEAVREEECQHLAREIHDTFGHALTDWKFDLAWLSRRLAEAGINGQSPIQSKLAAMSQRAETEMESVRRISGELRPALLDTLGLPSAVEGLARDFQTRTRIRCRLALLPDLPPLDAARSTAIFRILQELLDNVVRHAKATAVGVRLAAKPGWVELRVRDNGCGIPERAATSPGSLGLLGIRERAAAFGGEVLIEGVRDKGTIATVRLPVTEASKGE